MAVQEAPPVTVAGICQAVEGHRRVHATADLRCRPALATGHRLLRVVEARLHHRAPALRAGELRAPFLLEILYDLVGPDGARVGESYRLPLTLTASLPPGWAGPAVVEPVRTRVTGAAIGPDRSLLLAGVHLSVRLG